MVDKIIELFLKKPERTLSGEELSGISGISRQAVWKKIQNLRKDGWKIEGSPGRGYRLVDTPSHVEFERIANLLCKPGFWEQIYLLETADSTNDFLLKKGEEGVASAIAVADTQPGGRGRMGRSWFSPPGKNINMSFLVPTRVPPVKIASITLVAGISVARAIEKETAVSCRLKWPNDVYLEGKKLCGILTEVVAEMDMIRFGVIGVGINVNSQNEDFPEELRDRVISLKDYCGEDIMRVNLAARISDGIADNLTVYEAHGFPAFIDEWNSLSYLKGKRVIVETGPEKIGGWVRGVDGENGRLQLECDNGVIKEVVSGDIRVVKD